jgi:mono/diheme cytochrome c family protein
MEGDRMSRVSWVLLVSIGFLAAGCGGGEEGGKSASAPAPAAATAPPAAAPAPPPPAASPTAALDCKNPTGVFRGDKARGATLYAQTCASCHGPGGKGDGPAAPKDPPPADHTDPKRMGALTDADIYKVICGGGASVGKSPLMAAWGPIVGDQGIRDLIAHIRSLAPGS